MTKRMTNNLTGILVKQSFDTFFPSQISTVLKNNNNKKHFLLCPNSNTTLEEIVMWS
jgi:hypothetical protein